MKYIKQLSILLVLSLTILGCSNDDDGSDTRRGASSQVINEFIYNGLNRFYLFREDQPLFISPSFQSLERFAQEGGRPEAFFEKLTVEEDRFSWIVDDFNELEASFRGESKSTGFDYIAIRVPGSDTDVFYSTLKVAEGSSADRAGIRRGDLFTRFNGEKLTVDNFRQIFNAETFNLGKASFEGGEIIDIDETVSLIKEIIVENPIAIEKTIEDNGNKIGYLLYNQFVRGSEIQLNETFGRFKGESIDDLIIDFRYNSGGSIDTAVALSSMITGQFENEIVVKQQWNPIIEEEFRRGGDGDALSTRFLSSIGDNNDIPINSLNLNRVYFIMTKEQTASASELVINGLKPYINVTSIGSGSVGKSEGSITLYDSPNFFSKRNVNPDHIYAMQPLVLRNVNSAGDIVPTEGLIQDGDEIRENGLNLGELGSLTDPLLQRVFNEINGISIAAKKTSVFPQTEIIGTSQNPNDPLYQQMYY